MAKPVDRDYDVKDWAIAVHSTTLIVAILFGIGLMMLNVKVSAVILLAVIFYIAWIVAGATRLPATPVYKWLQHRKAKETRQRE